MRALIAVAALLASGAQAADTRWSAEQANAWYAQQPWPTGADYIPASAINQLEMWQAATWDPAEIDRELGWAETEFGMNTMRVFLHDLTWSQDPAGFKKRVDQFLAIAARHHIRPVFVLFDSCWDPNPKLGPQHAPIPGVHNSGWVQSPGRAALMDPGQEKRLHDYVTDMLASFGQDKRILAWDVWNEPDNTGGGSYDTGEDARVKARVADLLAKTFAWARATHPIQPLTSGLWTGGDWSPLQEAALNPIQRIQLDQSDLISFHNYGWPEDFQARVDQLKLYGRPIICTEWMARSAGSTADTVLPLGWHDHVGMINWGFVLGKTQTNFPWESWDHPYVKSPPVVWFHDLVEPDGTPYRASEAKLFRMLRAQPAG